MKNEHERNRPYHLIAVHVVTFPTDNRAQIRVYNSYSYEPTASVWSRPKRGFVLKVPTNHPTGTLRRSCAITSMPTFLSIQAGRRSTCTTQSRTKWSIDAQSMSNRGLRLKREPDPTGQVVGLDSLKGPSR